MNDWESNEVEGQNLTSGYRQALAELSFFKPCPVVTAIFLGVSAAAAQEQGGQSLEQAANDPTASLMAFQLQDSYSPDLYNRDGSLNIVQFRAAIPFELGGTNNIARLTLPYVTENGETGETGLADTTLFNLVAFDRSWGRFGVGAVALLPSGDEGVGAGKWALGPAVGFAAQGDGVLWGLFNQNLFTVGERFDGPDVNVSIFQPLLSVQLGDGWSTGVSEMTFVYDWDAGEFTSLPLGFKVAKLTRLSGVPVQFTANVEHNFYDEGFGPENTISFIAKVLLPTG